ncbi:MAG: undecaprenyldiphospho-muramoylpentapeptide beta-N-acetylglucosaminyltransferase [Steroidobacteraceae bacterium]|nr:undecaprenyldiphospho-muramoylpentapeptide beta-N-acetylglucosaminyltransferase [Steroidobacteraceae bacterium]
MSGRPILIMAGGTGGHVFPALALARLLRAASHEVVWLGTQRGLEARVVPAENIPIEWLSMSGLRGKGFVTLLAAPFKLAHSIFQALSVMRRRNPGLVVGFGGFVTGPGGIAAWLTRRPLVIHEQNAIAGYSNRMLARFSRRVLAGFPKAFPPGVDAQIVGNPVRAEIALQPSPAERFARRDGALRLLVVGGSLGAARLNSVVPFAVKASGLDLHVRHQAGERGIDAARAAYAQAGVRGDVTPFIDDMAAAYADADLVICRAGALTISELAAVGVGSVLVPFPAAVDDHQTFNAQFLVREGAAVLIADRDLTPERLTATLKELCAARGKLLAMAERARLVARPKAAEELAAICLEELAHELMEAA